MISAFLTPEGATFMPRRPSESTNSDPIKPGSKPRVRFIFEPDRTSPNGITYFWLIHDTYNGKEKAATATRAFWLPFAYRHSGDYTEAELRDLAQQSIWQMEAQIQHLREEFGLGTGTPSPTVSELVGAPEATAPSPATIPTTLPTQSAPAGTPDPDLLDEFADVL